jgi:hypothetical protein
VWYSGKAHAHGGNIQAVLAPDGFPLWVSGVELGSVHDLTAARLADMTAELTGPAGLGRLDEVTIRIRDYIPKDYKPYLDFDLTQEQFSQVIWSPYRFYPGVQRTDPDGRAHGPFGLPKREPYTVLLEPTIAPSCITSSYWSWYEGKPVRLEITCRRAGYEPWILLLEVKPDSEPRAEPI